VFTCSPSVPIRAPILQCCLLVCQLVNLRTGWSQGGRMSSTSWGPHEKQRCSIEMWFRGHAKSVGSGGQFLPSVWLHNPATGFRPPSATVVSAELFSHGTGTLWCLQKEIATYRHWYVSLWRDPDDVPHCRILSPDKTEWRLISATLCRWRCCFVADQLWFMTHIREEE